MRDWESFLRLSPRGAYRYALSRKWIGGGKVVTFIMLNPSTADAVCDDPTIRRCLSFAHREGGSELRVVNLYALRATNPRDLWAADDPVGEWNDEALAAGVRGADLVVAAWGAHGRLDRVAAALRAAGSLTCLGINSGGSPKHPLYLPSAARLVRFRAIGAKSR